MNGLMLHCGANAVTRDQLHLVPTPAALGARHHPYPFGDFADLVIDTMAAAGWRVKDEAYGLAANSLRMFGVLEVEPLVQAERDYALVVGLRGSHDQSFPRALAAGSRVFVCDNLAFSGTIRVSTRQTTNIERRMPGMILEAVRQLDGTFAVQDARFEQYRLTQVSEHDADAAFTRLVRVGGLPASSLPRALAEWDEPSHEEHAEDGRSVWRFFNAVTEAIKPPVVDGVPVRAHTPAAMTRTVRLTNVCDRLSAFAA